MKVVIAEKPSVAKSIAAVIGADKSADGYISGNGYYVTWCYGHLVELVMPEAYDEKYKKWSINTLPIIPDKWMYDIKKDTKTQFNVIKGLLDRADVTDVICATDAGREGELIFRNVYEKSGCKKPVWRLWISSMEDKSIMKGFEQLRDGKDFDNLYMAAKSREQSDWLVGMNLSRLFTLIYGGGNKLSIGRVMTPTLALICERDEKIEHFVKEKYYVVHISDGKGIDAVSKSYKDRLEAVTLCDRLNGDTAKVVGRLQEPKEKAAPLLYDLTSLQRDCNRMFGFSANKTLDIAQELYEKKLTTYPRTDAKYLTSDMGDKI
jgi:DNA topoisomerase-3